MGCFNYSNFDSCGSFNLLFSKSISSSKSNLGENNGKEFRLYKTQSNKSKEYKFGYYMLEFKNKKNSSEIISGIGKHGSPILSENSMLIYDDNFNALKNLLVTKKEKIDLVYIDPPFNTNQIFAISDTRVSTISRTKNGTVAYSDKMGKDEFLAFIYDRFVLIHALLSQEGSLYVHINSKMAHYFKIMLDEIFGDENFKNDITRIKSNPKNFDRKAYGNLKDVILFYSKNYKKNIWNDVRIPLSANDNIEKSSLK